MQSSIRITYAHSFQIAQWIQCAAVPPPPPTIGAGVQQISRSLDPVGKTLRLRIGSTVHFKSNAKVGENPADGNK